MPFLLHIAYGCLFATMAEFSDHNRSYGLQGLKQLLLGPYWNKFVIAIEKES